MKKRSPKRVCFPFVGDTIGGSKISTLLLAKGLNDLGYDILFVLHKKGPLRTEVENYGFAWKLAPALPEIANVSRIKQVLRMVTLAPSLARFIRQNNIDIVHSNDSKIHIFWGLAARLAEAKFIWHHRTASMTWRSGILSFFAHSTLTISKYCSSKLPNLVAKRTTVVDNPFNNNIQPINKEEAKNNLSQELGITNNDAVVGFVSNFIYWKRPLFFVEVAKKLCDLFSRPIYFPMFGDFRDISFDDINNKIHEYNLQDQFFLMGTKSSIAKYMSGFDIMIAPSICEPFGRTLVEAFLVNTPVIASDDGGHKEIIEHKKNGILVPPDDIDAFTQAAIFFLEYPHYAKKLSNNAYYYARNRFSITNHAQQVHSIYENLYA